MRQEKEEEINGVDKKEEEHDSLMNEKIAKKVEIEAKENKDTVKTKNVKQAVMKLSGSDSTTKS